VQLTSGETYWWVFRRGLGVTQRPCAEGTVGEIWLAGVFRFFVQNPKQAWNHNRNRLVQDHGQTLFSPIRYGYAMSEYASQATQTTNNFSGAYFKCLVVMRIRVAGRQDTVLFMKPKKDCDHLIFKSAPCKPRCMVDRMVVGNISLVDKKKNKLDLRFAKKK